MIDKISIIKKTVSYRERKRSAIYKINEINQNAARIWRKYASGETRESLLEQALENENLSFEKVTSSIAISNPLLAIDSKENQWIDDIDTIEKLYFKHNCPSADSVDFKSKSIPQICLLPFVEYLTERIITSDVGKNFISKEAMEEYSYMLMNRLCFIANDTILTCARYFEKKADVPYWGQTPIGKLGLEFIRWFYHEGITQMINEYPMVAKRLIEFVNIHFNNFCEFALNFQHDKKRILTELLNATEELDLIIEHIVGNLSDSHNGGKAVMRLELSSGDRIYYKPRSMAVDIAWYSFADRLSKFDFPAKLCIPKTINMGDYGYMQEIEYKERASDEELHKYYYNAGGLCCVISMLGGSDFHHENIIAHGTTPVLIDVETIITPKPASLYGLPEVNKTTGTYTHVGRTLMLQHWVGNSIYVSQDIGGFTSEQDDTRNIPSAENGIKKGAEYYCGDFISGFEAAYDFFLKERETIKNEKWLDVFENCNFRYVFRRTELYYALIKHFYSATFMRDMTYFEGALSRFGAGILLNFEAKDAKKIWNIVFEEKSAARLGDIPYFICKGNSKELFSANGLCVTEFFDAAPVDLAKQNLQSMSQENKIREAQYIKLELETCFNQKQFANSTPILSYQKARRNRSAKMTCSSSQLEHEIKKLIKTVDSFELSTGEFNFYAPVRNRKNTRYNIEVLPNDIYSGTLGVLITQAAYSQLAGNEELERKVCSKIEKLFAEEFHNKRGSSVLDLSFTQGLAGFIQSTIIIAKILGKEELPEMALSAVQDVPDEYLTRCLENDFFSGMAGTLYYFSKLYHMMPNPKLKEKIEIISLELLDRSIKDDSGRKLWHASNEYKPLTGLAHGQSGIAIALLNAWDIIEVPQLREIAESLIEYETTCFSNKEGNWFDFRKFNVKLRGFEGNNNYEPRFMYGYCSGAPGIGLARIIASRNTNSLKYEVDIRRAIEFCKNKSIIGNDSLCCGSSAWIDLLVEASLYYEDEELLDIASEICAAIIPKKNHKGYIISSLNGTADISLFKGYSGIAYQFMRVLDPKKIPSIII